MLFCPFCREPFDGVAECPDHGLALVTLEALARADAKRIPDEHARLASHDLRFGRGIVVVGAALTWLSLWLPVVRDGFRDGATTTGFALWSLRADYLAVVPGAAFVALFTVFIRTTRAQLQRVRVALGVALALAFVSVAMAFRHVLAYAHDAQAAGEMGEVSAGSGVYVAVGGLLVLAYGVHRLGKGR